MSNNKKEPYSLRKKKNVLTSKEISTQKCSLQQRCNSSEVS